MLPDMEDPKPRWPENIEQVQRLIEEDPHSTYDDIIQRSSPLEEQYLELFKIILKWKKLPPAGSLMNWLPQQEHLRVKICKENLA